MTSFTVEYQDPCEKTPVTKPVSRKESVITEFESIDWFQHKKDVIYSHNAPDERVVYGDALHD